MSTTLKPSPEKEQLPAKQLSWDERHCGPGKPPVVPQRTVEDETLTAGFVSLADLEYDEPYDRVSFNFGVTRRSFVQLLGAGLMIAVCEFPAEAQEGAQGRGGPGRGGPRGGGAGGFLGGGPVKLAARLHINNDGNVTVFCGKVECGQGSAGTEFTLAAAEELRLPLDRVSMVLADTGLVPNDGLTAGSGSTPNTIPVIRQAAAAARNVLVDLASNAWNVERSELEARDGKVIHNASNREKSYGELASSEEAAKAFADTMPTNATLPDGTQWKVMGTPTPRPNRKDLVTGKHQYPSDIIRPGMLYGKVLRAAHFGFQSKPGKLKSVDTAAVEKMDGVSVVKDGDLVGVVAPNAYLATQAIEALASNAEWEQPRHVASKEMFTHLENSARGIPQNPHGSELSAAAKTLKQDYHVAYVQHSPMEPRAAVAEWDDDKLTVWTATQNPFGVRGELVTAFRTTAEKVRVIVPDFGGGFGGRHTGEHAVEAARLAKSAGKPVHLQWTRPEEFTWAQFRPADLVKAEASLDGDGKITSWYYISINADRSELETPYTVGKNLAQSVATEAPLRHGSYRGLGATGHTFARECFMDELAEAADKDPLEFRLKHLDNSRIRAVLEDAAKRFGWEEARAKQQKNVGVGIACGQDKGSVVACCAEVEVDPVSGEIKVRRVTESFECGAIINPENLRTQVLGAVIMGLGPALREEMIFEDGQMQNAAFSKYLVPRFADVPELDISLVNRPDQRSAGAGETPIIAIAPAIASAVFHATGQRMRSMPMRL